MTTTHSTPTEELADLLVRSVIAGDTDTLRERVYAPGAVIWHNFDQVEQDLEANMRVMRWMNKRVSDLSYDDIRRQVTANGFVQQHVLRGTAADGSTLEVPACLVVTVTDGKVSRLEEYLDTAQVAALSR